MIGFYKKRTQGFRVFFFNELFILPDLDGPVFGEHSPDIVLVQPVPFFIPGQVAPVAAHGILAYLAGQACPHRVAVDISHQFQQVVVSICQDRFVAASKQGAVALVTDVITLCINPV